MVVKSWSARAQLTWNHRLNLEERRRGEWIIEMIVGHHCISLRTFFRIGKTGRYRSGSQDEERYDNQPPRSVPFQSESSKQLVFRILIRRELPKRVIYDQFQFCDICTLWGIMAEFNQQEVASEKVDSYSRLFSFYPRFLARCLWA